METLHLNSLPDLPQQHTIREVAIALWQRNDIVALWLGGSLAGNTGDAFSDVDFRVAVAPPHLTTWEAPPFEQIFIRAPVVGRQFLRFGDVMLHHLILANGEIFDFCIQSTESELTPEPQQILGCRNDLFAHKLAQNPGASSDEGPQPPRKETLQSLLIDFWINTHKHRKILYRGLDLLCIRRIQMERDLLLRLWYLQSSGRDYGTMRQTVHSATEVVRLVGQSLGTRALHILGAPTRNRQELIAVIEMNREVVAGLGRQLARQYTFEYPSVLEAAVLKCWQDFARERLAEDCE